MYADIDTLYRTTIDRNPDCWMAHYNLGLALADRGQLDEAIDHYKKAMEIQPDYAEAHYNLGIALASRGQLDEAIAHYKKAIEIQPDIAQAVEAHDNLGALWRAAARSTRPLPTTRRRLKSSPTTWRLTTTLVALAGRGQIDEAIAHYKKAIEIQPDDVKAHNNLGALLADRGQTDEAIAHYRKYWKSLPTIRASATTWRGYWQPVLTHPSATAPKQSHWANGPKTFRRTGTDIFRHAGGCICRGGPVFRSRRDRSEGDRPGHTAERADSGNVD